MRGLLLINLGTPDSTSVTDVRKYLKSFLSDPYVIDINPIVRWLLLNLIILPTRPKKSAEAYREIWTEQGSPLLINSEHLAQNAQDILGTEFKVSLAMRYGNPSMALAVEELTDCEDVVVLPLFPQYSLAATETAIQYARQHLKPYWPDDKITIIQDFYKLPGYITAQANLIKQSLQQVNDLSNTKILFSYHGIPERQIAKLSDCISNCSQHKACSAINMKNALCYRAQCYATSRTLANELGLSAEQYQTSFQSRLGRIPWIKPYTDEVLPILAEQGVKNLVVACPSFVADCLETLEEIGIRAKEQWQALGGEALYLVPCVNADASWIADCIKGN